MHWPLDVYQTLQAVWWVIQVIWAFGALLFSWYLRSVAKTAKETNTYRENVRDQLADKERRITELENKIPHLPTHEDISNLVNKLGETNERLAHIMGEFKAMSHTVDMVNKYLLTRGDK